MEVEELYSYCFACLIEEGLEFDAAFVGPAVKRLCEDKLIECDDAAGLTARSWNYLAIVVGRRSDPLGAANLLSALFHCDLLNEDYPFAKANLKKVRETAFPQDIAHFYDRVYRFKTMTEIERFQTCFDSLCQFTSEQLIQLTARIELLIEHNDQLIFDQFEDELQLIIRSRYSNRLQPAALAYDTESAMQPLTFMEDQRLSRAMDHYMWSVEKIGVDTCYSQLLEYLSSCYRNCPLSLKKSLSTATANASLFQTQDIQLPLTWGEFERLPLTEKERQEALQLYYQNPLHTAYRFFSEIETSTPWISKTPLHWRPFLEHKTLLAVLWTAVTDKAIEPIDEYTHQGRVDHFIESFAEYRRAHNQDKRRPRADRPGEYEFYDDREGDKPGCLLAFRQRAFDSVQGHPLFKILSDHLLWKEVCERVELHFKKRLQTKFDDKRLSDLSHAWQMIIDGEKPNLKPLARLNVPKKLQRKWMRELKEKYVDFEMNASLREKYRQWFKLNTRTLSHAEIFGGAVFLDKLLECEQNQRCKMRPQQCQTNGYPFNFLLSNGLTRVSAQEKMETDNDAHLECSHADRSFLG